MIVFRTGNADGGNRKYMANDNMLDNPRLRKEYEEIDPDCDIYPARFLVRKER